MNNRFYNIFFHLHTVSGITIGFALFIIFYAGAFALFEHEIHEWEEAEHPSMGMRLEPGVREQTLRNLNYDQMMDRLSEAGFTILDRDVSFMTTGKPGEVSVYISGSSHPQANEEERQSQQVYYSVSSGLFSLEGDHFSIGSLLYELHYFAQLGRVGHTLAGFVALFFLFALVTGVLIHWKKIVSNFFVFRPGEKLKTIWTDAHTALGVIGLPYQFMYALTGAFFCLGTLAYDPAVMLYGGDTQAYRQDMGSLWPSFPLGESQDSLPSLQVLVEKTYDRWGDYLPTYVAVNKYGNSNMHLQIDGRLNTQERFVGFGTIVYKTSTGEEVKINDPYQSDYVDAIPKLAYMLHYGEFDDMVGEKTDLFFRIIYFLLALLTCFVMLSGILIWLEARNKKSIPEERKRFNQRVGHLFISVCLTLIPVTALGFLGSKFTPDWKHEEKELLLNTLFFGSWLVLTVVFSLRRDNQLTTRFSLLAGGILGCLIPVASGVLSGNWLWVSFAEANFNLLLIDGLWLSMGASCLIGWSCMSAKGSKASAGSELQL